MTSWLQMFQKIDKIIQVFLGFLWNYHVISTFGTEIRGWNSDRKGNKENLET